MLKTLTFYMSCDRECSDDSNAFDESKIGWLDHPEFQVKT